MSPKSRYYYFFLPCFKTVSVLPHVIIIVIIASGVTDAVLPFPVVTLRRLDQRQFDNLVSNVSNDGNTVTFRKPDSEYQVPVGTQTITLLCWASYPVYWALNENQYNSQSIWRMRVGTRRTVQDLFDYSRYNYTAMLELHGSGGGMGTLSGRYTCQAARNRSLASSVYLYWDESGKFHPNQFLVLSKETHGIPAEANLILPCYLTKPTAPRPLLYKDNQELRPNSSINFDPKIGFKLSDLVNPQGIYKCVINETEDYVVIIASGGNKTVKSVKFDYNIDKREISCCSEDHTPGAKTPNVAFFYCETAILCEAFGNHAVPDGHGQRLDVVRSTSRPGCSIYKVRYFVSGLIICGGKDFVNASRHIVFPFTALINAHVRAQANGGKEPPKPLHPPAWSSWEEMEPEDMMGILSMERTPDGHGFVPMVNSTRRDVYYSGQTVTVECLTQPFYFAGGIQWALSYENKTVQILNETDNGDLLVDNDEFSMKHNDHFDTLTITADENLVSVICIAPVWNSSVWVHKSFFPYVNRSSVPQVVLISEESSIAQWNVNETGKGIICEATGSPLPMFSWFKDNDTILASHNTDITEMRNGTNILRSTLTIQRVSYHSGGVYTCVASNFAGQNETSVQVHVLEMPSMSAAAEVGITISCVVGVFLVGGLLLWKFSGSTGHEGWLSLLRQRLRQNPSSEGQNVESNGSAGPRRGADGSDNHHVGGNSADTYNQSFDSVTMRADLLN